MRMNVAPVFETLVQAQQHSLFDRGGKSTFPLSARFPVVHRNSHGMEEKMQDWRWDLEGQWNGLSEAEGPVEYLRTQTPTSRSCLAHKLCKACPSIQFRKEHHLFPWSIHSIILLQYSAIALSEGKCLNSSSPTLSCSIICKYSCRIWGSTSQTQAVTWEFRTLKVKQ